MRRHIAFALILAGNAVAALVLVLLFLDPSRYIPAAVHYLAGCSYTVQLPNKVKLLLR
jgi:hypothetical protein